MSEANELTNKILDHLYRNKVYAWRQNSTGIWDKTKGIYRPSGKKGVSDILGCLPPTGKLLAIEVKIGRDHTSDEQKGFLSNVKSCGGIALAVKTYEDFLEQWAWISTS